MKNLFFIICSVLLFSNCNESKQTKKVILKTQNFWKVKKDKSPKTDTIHSQNNISNSSKLEDSPIKIVKATLLDNSYSHHKDIKIAYQNSSKKSIKAIKLEWYCINAFEEPANGNYFYGEGNFKGNVTTLIKSGQTKTQVWEDFSTDADKIIKVRAYYIVYNDGTKWELNNEKASL